MGEAVADVTPEVLAECRTMADIWAPVLRALGNSDRLLIVLWLADSDGSVRELERVTGLSQSLISYHLAELRKRGLVTASAVGRTNRYALARPELNKLSELLGTLDVANRATS